MVYVSLSDTMHSLNQATTGWSAALTSYDCHTVCAVKNGLVINFTKQFSLCKKNVTIQFEN